MIESNASATTTAEQDRKSSSQRRVNAIWETTQAAVTLSVTGATIYAALHGIESSILNNGFLVIVATYLTRTNHTKVGGVPADYTGR